MTSPNSTAERLAEVCDGDCGIKLMTTGEGTFTVELGH
jgi:hypothetical protein